MRVVKRGPKVPEFFKKFSVTVVRAETAGWGMPVRESPGVFEVTLRRKRAIITCVTTAITNQGMATPQNRVPVLNRPNMVSVGTMAFLAQELMFFAGLFAMYFPSGGQAVCARREVHREQTGKEHELLGEERNRAHADHVRTVQRWDAILRRRHILVCHCGRHG